MNHRLKIIRDNLGLNQDEFAVRLHFSSKTYISLLENGKRQITTRTIKDICREFDVNEEWLRTGNGEIFLETKENFIHKIAKEMNLTGFELALLEEYAKLAENQKEIFRKFLRDILKNPNIMN